MKKKFAIAFAFLLAATFTQAQTNSIDSLHRLLQTKLPDTTRANTLNSLAYQLSNSRPDSSLLLAQQALTISRKENFKSGEIRSLNVIGNAFAATGNNNNALQYYFQALKIAEEQDDLLSIGKINGNIGVLYSSQGDQRKAVEYTLKSLQVAKQLSDAQFTELALGNLGDAYTKLDLLDSGLYYTNKTHELAAQLRDTFYIALALNNSGNIYLKMSNYQKALSSYRAGLPFLKQMGMDDGLCETYLGMARVFQSLGKSDSALYFAKLSLQTAQQGGFVSYTLDAAAFLTNYYKAAGNVDSAFTYQTATIVAKDSLFSQEKQREFQSLTYDEMLRQQQVDQARKEAKTELKFTMLLLGLLALLVVAFLLFRNNRQKQKANVQLTVQKQKVESTLQELKSTQAQLVQSEKMASLGELTAGIAHEIQNPLNFVNNFSEVNKELLLEMKDEIDKGNINGVKAIADDLIDNQEKINHHGKRADSIVKGMMQHSQVSTGQKEPTDINALADEYLRLSFHGIRAKEKSFNATIKTEFDKSIGKVNVIPQDIGRVLLNLYNNAFYAINEKNTSLHSSGQASSGQQYKPLVSVQTKKANDKIEIKVSDNGNGIPQNIVDKIFQPFFTTKPTGQGTGLGLSLSYDIIKAHGGEIKVETTEDEGSKFLIRLPLI